MDLEALSFFGQVVESGSFSGAARVLGLPRQKVHRRISALERDLGLRLIERTTRAMRLTAAGQSLSRHAGRILEEGRAAQATLRLAAEHPSGTVRVTTTPLFGDRVLSVAVNRFLVAWPETRVEAILSMRPEPLLERDLDLAIRFGPLPDSTLFAREIGRSQLVLCASRSYLANAGTPSSPGELPRYALIGFTPEPGATQTWLWRGGEPSMPLRTRLSCTSEAVVLRACQDGIGIACLPYVLCHEALASGELVEVLPSYRTEPMPFHAVYASRMRGNPTLEALLEMIEDESRGIPWCHPDESAST